MKLVSACLLGCECRYDQRSCTVDRLQQQAGQGELLPVCPEQLAGLPTPREPAEIVGGDGFDVLDGNARVIQRDGMDVTEAYIRGAKQALHLAKLAGVTEAVLKENSPSCGSRAIYDGTFSGTRRGGPGVTAALLMRHGIVVRSEESIS